MCADLFHYGHVKQLQRCRELCEKEDKVIVGIHSDKTIESYKRIPIMNMKERIAVVEACKYDDVVIPDAPLTLTEYYIKKHNISMVCTSDNRSMEETILMYSVAVGMGILKILPHTNSISTSSIIQRVQKNKR